MGRTLQLFERPKMPRIIRMHVIDAGDSGCSQDDAGGICVYKCSRCGHQTEWVPFRTTTEAKRGVPCPKCNAVGKTEKP